MQTSRTCVVCILNQVLRVADHLGLEEEQKDRVFQKAIKKAAGLPYQQLTAPEFSEQIYHVVAEVTGDPDPYKTLRKEQNRMVLDNIDAFRSRIAASSDPLLTAGYYALLGNIIDYGGVRIFDAGDILEQGETIDITVNDYSSFGERLAGARRVLILADNAGEAVFDRLFIEEMKRFNPRLEVVYGVRSAPAINDVILQDALDIGIRDFARVIETGATCAGTVVSRCTPEFREIYYGADIIISKGQGNFETLENEPEDILFIFKVKCDVVAQYIGLPLNSLVFSFRKRLRDK